MSYYYYYIGHGVIYFSTVAFRSASIISCCAACSLDPARLTFSKSSKAAGAMPSSSVWSYSLGDRKENIRLGEGVGEGVGAAHLRADDIVPVRAK